MGASGARMEKLRNLGRNYKGLKLCDRLVIEHQQSERPTRTVGVWWEVAQIRGLLIWIQWRDKEGMKMTCEFRMLFDEMDAVHDDDDDEKGGGQRQTTCATRGIG